MDARTTRGLQLSFTDVSQSYNGRPAVQVNSLTIASGSITVLLGRSGCGKSTLLKLAAGLLRPDHGAVLHDGDPLRDTSAESAIVFQHNNLFPWMSAAQNVAFALRNRGHADGEAHELSLQLLAEVGLRDFARHKPAQLSGGMRQRVALARTLATGPRLLMLDEPFSALDVQTRRLMQSYLLQVWRRIGATVLMVTHDLDEALAIADRIVLMGAQPTGHVAQVIDIPEPRPQTLDAPVFRALAAELNAFLVQQARQAEHAASAPIIQT